MIYAIIAFVLFLWIVYELETAPFYDEKTKRFYKNKKELDDSRTNKNN